MYLGAAVFKLQCYSLDAFLCGPLSLLAAAGKAAGKEETTVMKDKSKHYHVVINELLPIGLNYENIL